MTELCVIVDQLTAPVPGGIGRYAEELTRQLIATAPRGSTVTGFVSASSEADYDSIADRLPGLAALHKSALDRRSLSQAWAHGFTRIPGQGMVHAPSQLAPLTGKSRARAGEQVAVTIHDSVAWTHPETLTPRGASWHRKMASRAERYADAIVVTSHSVAAQLSELLELGDRIRVIPAAVSSALKLPADADVRAATLGLPDRYLLAVGTLEPRKRLDSLVEALATAALADIPLVHVGPPGWGGVELSTLAADAGVDPSRILALGRLSDEDLAVAYSRASVFVFPSLAEGFGLPVLEAFSLGAPVVHSDDPAVAELSAGAGIEVAQGDGYVDRLAEAIRGVLDDDALARRLSILGHDRAGGFSWRDSAEKVWQLHADL